MILLVGTRKGLFLVQSEDRNTWNISPPLHPGWAINHAVYDPRTSRIWVCAYSEVYGPALFYSDDRGTSWEECPAPRNPDQPIKKLWHLCPGIPVQPGVLYLGAEPAQLWMSENNGNTWVPNLSLNEHPTREKWEPGNGGLCLHTILIDPQNPNRLWVGISAAGCFRSEDGGKTWHPKNQNVRCDYNPDPFPEVGHCVHKMAMDAGNGSVLYQQNHCGFYRSENGGDFWEDVSGDPEFPRFGFALASHPRKPGVLWRLPLTSDAQRFTPEGKIIVLKSHDGGKTWQIKTEGLPQEHAYAVVLREGMTADRLEPAGVYFGTTGGALFASRDEGETWRTLANFLPPILSVACA